MVKGGISLGRFFHDENIVFGEALSKSASLEETHSEPNIVIEEQLISVFIDSANKLDLGLTDESLGRTFKYSADNEYSFLHYLYMATYSKQISIPNYISDGSDTLEEHRKGLEKAIRRSMDSMNSSVALKYLWAIEYHNDTTQSDRDDLRIPGSIKKPVLLRAISYPEP